MEGMPNCLGFLAGKTYHTVLALINLLSVSHFQNKNSQLILFNIDDNAIIPNSEAIIRRIHNSTNMTMRVCCQL